MSSPEAKRAKTTTSTRAGDSNVPGTAEAPADNGWLAALHAERLKRRGLAPVMSERDAERARANERASAIASAATGGRAPRSASLSETLRARRERAGEADATAPRVREKRGDIRLLTYNVWFGDVATVERLEALGKVIEECDPHALCLQEVTPQAMFVLRSQAWWERYVVGPKPPLQEYFSMMLFKRTVRGEAVKRDQYPFRNSQMGRYLDVVSYMRCPSSLRTFAVGSSHLESYINANRTSAKERRVQIAECFSWLNKHENAIFMGDTNWDDKDGDVPLPPEWRDAWLEMHPNDPGYTYDARKNAMLRGYLRKRLDRAFVKLKHFDVKSIEMVGTQPIPGVTYHKTVSNRGKAEIIELPVVPSDHFGLLLTLRGSKQAETDGDDQKGVVDLT